MSESTDVQRVRVVDQWAVKTARGEYLDANAVSTVNTIVIVMLVLLTVFWVAVAYLQAQALVYVNGSDIIHWEPSTLGAILLVAVNFAAALLHLFGVSLIVRHNASAPFLIQLFCGLLGVGGVLQANSIISYGVFAVPVYIVIAALIGIVRPYFKR